MPNDLIEKDSFLDSMEYKNYEKYRIEKKNIETSLTENYSISKERLNLFKSLNPDSWDVYFLVGKYYYQHKFYKEALIEFEKALSKEITTVIDKEEVESYIKKAKRKLNDS